MKILELNYPRSFKKAQILIDDNDWERASQYSWYLLNHHGYYYPVCTINSERIKMANFLLNIPNNQMIDHKNMNTLDQQKENLRPCNHLQNSSNKNRPANNKTGFKGVSWVKRDKCYNVRIYHYNKPIHIMNTKNLIEGAKAYNAKAIELFGEFARLNVIPEGK